MPEFMDREFIGTVINTFTISISTDGLIAKEYQGVDFKIHVGVIIADLKTLQQA